MVELGLVSENRDFGILWLSQLISKFGDGLRRIALPWLIFTLTGSPLQLAISFALSSVPDILLSPISGYYVDKASRKKILIACSLLQAVVIAVIPISNVMGLLNIYMIYGIMVLLSISGGFFYETRHSLLPEMVGDENLDEANSFIHGTVALVSLFSVTLGGIFVSFIGITFTFIIDSITFFTAGMVISLAALPSVKREIPEKMGERLKEVFHDNVDALKEIRGTVIEKLVIFGFPLNLAMVPLVIIFTDIGYTIYGSVLVFTALMVVRNLGMLSGNYFVNKIPGKRSTKIYGGVLTAAVFILSFGLFGYMVEDVVVTFYLPILATLLILTFLIYLSQPIFNVPSDSMVQMEGSERHRGKILSLTNAALNVPFPFAYLLGGLLLSTFSPFYVVIMMGIIVMITGIAEAVYFRRREK